MFTIGNPFRANEKLVSGSTRHTHIHVMAASIQMPSPAPATFSFIINLISERKKRDVAVTTATEALIRHRGIRNFGLVHHAGRKPNWHWTLPHLLRRYYSTQLGRHFFLLLLASAHSPPVFEACGGSNFRAAAQRRKRGPISIVCLSTFHFFLFATVPPEAHSRTSPPFLLCVLPVCLCLTDMLWRQSQLCHSCCAQSKRATRWE